MLRHRRPPIQTRQLRELDASAPPTAAYPGKQGGALLVATPSPIPARLSLPPRIRGQTSELRAPCPCRHSPQCAWLQLGTQCARAACNVRPAPWPQGRAPGWPGLPCCGVCKAGANHWQNSCTRRRWDHHAQWMQISSAAELARQPPASGAWPQRPGARGRPRADPSTSGRQGAACTPRPGRMLQPAARVQLDAHAPHAQSDAHAPHAQAQLQPWGVGYSSEAGQHMPACV
jgi:hypothetical protein